MGRRAWIDRSPGLILAVCGCGWREAADDQMRAWRKIADHMVAAHSDPEARQAAQQKCAYHRRQN